MRQEVKAPELQRLELLGKTALAIIKYLPLGAPHAAQVRLHFENSLYGLGADR